MRGLPQRKSIGCYARGMRHVFLEEIVHGEECINCMKLAFENEFYLNKEFGRQLMKIPPNPHLQEGHTSG